MTSSTISASDERPNSRLADSGASARLLTAFSWPLLLGALTYALVLSLSMSRSSLWTDEAFSAWVASHRDFQSMAHSLLTGDSSDLQSGLYYVYLFFWARLWGTSELALRLANIPFIVTFSVALVWTSWAVFRSRVAWVAAGMLPFVWYYSSEARAYMAALAISSVSFAALLGFLRDDSPTRLKRYPWICLSAILAGTLFHMLFLLALPPMAVIVAFAYFSDPAGPRWRNWIAPAAAFVLPFCALAVFLVFTFHRGPIDYDYPRPGARQMVSVFYELLGMFNFGPNRKLSLDFRPYLVPSILGGLALLSGGAILVAPALRKGVDRLMMGLAVAASLCFFEVVAFCFAVGKQVDARHLAALVPLFLFLLIGLLSLAPSRDRTIAILLVGGAWLVADIRGKTLPVYQREDYRDAVQTALRIHRQTGAVIALASDPVGPAYYGLEVQGPAPCYPIGVSCSEAFSRVSWPRKAPAVDGNKWSHGQIVKWLTECSERNLPVAVLVQLDRAAIRESDWWPVLHGLPIAPVVNIHGFKIVLLSPPTVTSRLPSPGPVH